MGTIIEKYTKRGEVRFQAKIRRTGVPIVSRVFPSREEAEAWLQATEPELQARSLQAARTQAQAKLIAKFKEQPRIVADLLHRHMQEETVHKKGAEAEVNHISSILRYPLDRPRCKVVVSVILCVLHGSRLSLRNLWKGGQ